MRTCGNREKVSRHREGLRYLSAVQPERLDSTGADETSAACGRGPVVFAYHDSSYDARASIVTLGLELQRATYEQHAEPPH
jgi:hypothetical protein